ncbi:hypothetical protein [Phormidium sp. CCY1219]|uniref:hypothetical protein n=1 Tax=Phormidium sp. CCY1219 TaxID=2886104 RepID=UPI002D1F8690|nr:hypothetical protein [Phormidium sp. CCY1219]MEB3831233.1 hypothetical protein [Phormidium sp. CCY1219]
MPKLKWRSHSRGGFDRAIDNRSLQRDLDIALLFERKIINYIIFYALASRGEGEKPETRRSHLANH